MAIASHPSPKGTKAGGRAPRVFRRRTARLVVLDRFERVLLEHGPARIRDAGEWHYSCPGSVVEDEEPAEAAARALRSAVGERVAPADLGIPVAACYSLQQLLSGEYVAADDAFFLWRTDGPATGDAVRLSPGEMESAPDRILPRGLPALVRSLLADGRPATPIHIRW